MTLLGWRVPPLSAVWLAVFCFYPFDNALDFMQVCLFLPVVISRNIGLPRDEEVTQSQTGGLSATGALRQFGERAGLYTCCSAPESCMITVQTAGVHTQEQGSKSTKYIGCSLARSLHFATASETICGRGTRVAAGQRDTCSVSHRRSLDARSRSLPKRGWEFTVSSEASTSTRCAATGGVARGESAGVPPAGRGWRPGERCVGGRCTGCSGTCLSVSTRVTITRGLMGRACIGQEMWQLGRLRIQGRQECR